MGGGSQNVYIEGEEFTVLVAVSKKKGVFWHKWNSDFLNLHSTEFRPATNISVPTFVDEVLNNQGASAVWLVPYRSHNGVEIHGYSKMDEKLFLKIALEDIDAEVRSEAVRWLQNQENLNKIAVDDSDWRVRDNAVHFLQNQAILRKIAVDDPDNMVRMDAKTRLRYLEGGGQ